MVALTQLTQVIPNPGRLTVETVEIASQTTAIRCLDWDRERFDIARLSPLGRKHINMLGRYYFLLAEPILKGELRSLRDPYAREEFDDLL